MIINTFRSFDIRNMAIEKLENYQKNERIAIDQQVGRMNKDKVKHYLLKIQATMY